MNTRTLGLSRFQWILAGVLVIQIILAVVLNLPHNTSVESKPLIGGFDLESIVDLNVVDQSGQGMHLAKVNGAWILPEAGNYPAKGDKVAEILAHVQNIKTNRLVTQTTASQKQLQVTDGDFLARLTLTDSDGKSQILYIGSSVGSGATHVRLAGKNQVYLTNEITSWDVSPTSSTWLDTAYLTLESDQIQSFQVVNANGVFSLSKDESGTWTLDDLAETEIMNSSAVESIVSRFTTLHLVDPLGTSEEAAWGLDQPLATATFGLADGTTQELTIGEILTGGNHAAKASSSPYYVSISEYNANSLIDMDRASLLQEPTPTPTPTP